MHLKPSINSTMNLPAEQNHISVGKSVYEKCRATSLLAKVGQRIPEAVEKASSAPGGITGGRRGEGRVSNSYQCSARDAQQQILSPSCLQMAGQDLPLPSVSPAVISSWKGTFLCPRSAVEHAAFWLRGKAPEFNGSLGKPDRL